MCRYCLELLARDGVVNSATLATVLQYQVEVQKSIKKGLEIHLKSVIKAVASSE